MGPLPPRKEIEEFVCSFSEMEEKNPSMRYEGTIEYEDEIGTGYKEAFVIDYSLRKGLVYIGKREPERELEGIRKALEKITSPSFKPLVRTISDTDYTQQMEQTAQEALQAMSEKSLDNSKS